MVGMSVDTVARLQKFRDKYDIEFAFASDHDRAVGAAYGTLKGDLTTTHERDTVLVGKDGTILLAFQRVSAQGHAAVVLAETTRLHAKGGL